MVERTERFLWRYHNKRGIWITYLAAFEDGRLVSLRNTTDDCDIPLDTKTARMLAQRHPKFRIQLPEQVSVPSSVKMRYAQRYKTARYTSA